MTGWTFEIHGEPKGKARARVTARGAFTPTETKNAERAAAWAAKAAGVKRLEGPVALDITCIHTTPQSWSKKRRLAAIGMFKVTKPDADNVLKLVKDALNGIAYADDNIVAVAHVTKIYGLTPRIIVHVRQATPLDLPAAAGAEIGKLEAAE